MLVDKYLLDIVPAEKVDQLVCLMQSLHEGWDEAAMGNHILWHLQNMKYLQLYVLLQTRQLTLQVFMKALIDEGTDARRIYMYKLLIFLRHPKKFIF